MAGPKYSTTAEVQLFIAPREGVDAYCSVPAGRPVETDAVEIPYRPRDGRSPQLVYYKCKVGKETGYILANRVAAE